jgi:hypothetical protein
LFPATLFAQQMDNSGCDGLFGFAKGQCLARQQQLQQQQLENLRLQNAILRKQLAGNQSTSLPPQEQGTSVDPSTNLEFQSWLASNP